MPKPLHLFLSVLLLLLGATAAPAQQGLALKGHYLYNSSDVNRERTDTLPAADGFGIGMEYVLPLGVGVGVSGYTSGGATDLDVETTSLVVLAEANYFFRLPVVPVSPYAGVHAGLGRYSREQAEGAERPRVRDSATELGFQVGLRVQLVSLLGLDAQYRRVSTSAFEEQGSSLERSQLLVGVTLF